ncbi:MAG: hypothetical protein P1V29_10380, partial [Gammaproteobacteria bacterium]|nr:hypothetical protein [Gammaproteobacteria bacterium]
QDAISDFGTSLGVRMDAKDMLVDMFMSPWFSGESISGYTFDSAHFESKFGSEQLLTPEQLAKKTRAITGVGWRTNLRPSGKVYSDYEELSILLGGIDSEVVTTRAIELTSTMTAILMTHATETACVAVARQFAYPIAERSLFTFVEESTQPQITATAELELPSKEENDWQTVSYTADLNIGNREISFSILNPECDWDGTRCVEQRILFISSVSVISPSGEKEKYSGDDPRLYSSNGGGCYAQSDGSSRCFNGQIGFDFRVLEKGKHRIEAVMASRLMPSKPDLLKLRLSVKTDADIFAASTTNTQLIKQQISHLFQKLHGTPREIDSEEVQTVFEIYATALVSKQASAGSDWEFENCSTWRDGYFYEDLLTPEQLAAVRFPDPIYNDSYDYDWDALNPIIREIVGDPLHTKYAWTAVMMYMLSHYDYLHE